ncbi:thiamine pyrophosphate-dependent enzyme [Chloroflexota bacterium]
MIRELHNVIERSGERPSNLSDWYKTIEQWKRVFPFSYTNTDKEIIRPQSVFQALNDELKYSSDNVIYVTDVGQHQMWAMQYLQVDNPLGFLTSGGSGTMGYGLPASFGAKIANPDKQVILVTGDQSFRMTTQTLELYSRHNTDIKIMVIDNKAFGGTPGGLVNQWYILHHRRTRVPVEDTFDIVDIARAYRIKAYTVKDPSDVVSSIRNALETPEPLLLQFIVDPYAHLYPMIPPGKTVWDTIFGSKWSANNEKLIDIRDNYK